MILYKYKKEGKKKYTIVDESGKPILLIKQYLIYAEKDRGLSINTINAYCLDISRFIRWTSEIGIDFKSVNNKVLRAYRDEELSKCKVATTRRAISSILLFYRYLHTFHNIEYNPKTFIYEEIPIEVNKSRLDGIAKSRRISGNLLIKSNSNNRGTENSNSPKAEILSEYEIEKVIDTCKNERDKLIITILETTAIRSGELLGIMLQDIDIHRSAINIVNRNNENGATVKPYNERMIPIPESLLNQILDYITKNYNDTKSQFLFTCLKGKRKCMGLTYDALYTMIKKLGVKSEVPRLHPHLIRKSTISKWVKFGMNKVILKAIIGHKNISTTEKYYIQISYEMKAEELLKYEKQKEKYALNNTKEMIDGY